MAVNISHPELSETKTQPLPPADLEVLKRMREDLCAAGSSDFKLQTHQRFLRRAFSPDSPLRNLLMVHGLGTGKTCSAIQVAEEYILRPEFQDKRVLVIANPPIQENFRSQIFSMNNVSIDNSGLLISKQCTGRRYLDMLTRIQSDTSRWVDRSVRERLEVLSKRLVNEFYEFKGYMEFGNEVEREKANRTELDFESWIHETFDNRLIIVDEAHNLKVETNQATVTKTVSTSLEKILKTASGITLCLLTATPMYDTYEEIIYYFNLFLWNDRRQSSKASITASKIFNPKDASFVSEEAESMFRGWCQDYISFVKGDNPFTFPFRLPPPESMIAPADRTRDVSGKSINPESQRKYLKLTQSILQSPQKEIVAKALFRPPDIDSSLRCVYYDGKPFDESFEYNREEQQYSYKKGIPRFFSPELIAGYSSKFALILDTISKTDGVVFVYSSRVQDGTRPFAMCLEEHGFDPAVGNKLLKGSPSGKGRYVTFTSDTSDADMRSAISRLKSRENINGKDIKVIIGSPKVSEGVDFKFVRQVHVLEPHWNMSELEQIVGRGIRTCSHALLPFEHQNTTVYFHICRFPDDRKETIDEYIYRIYVEPKAERISRVKKVIMESAMDCPLELNINSLPDDWKALTVPQIRSQDMREVNLSLSEMTSPSFGMDLNTVTCNVKESPKDPLHTRPLSSYLDVSDEILDKIGRLFLRKPVWKKEDLLNHQLLRVYEPDVVIYTLQNAIATGFKFKDVNNRTGTLESKGKVYSFTVKEGDTLQEKLIPKDTGVPVNLSEYTSPQSTEETVDLTAKKEALSWIAGEFTDEILEWYIVDQVLSKEDRLKYMLSLDLDNLPIFARVLKTENLYILGSGKVYNHQKQEIQPVGELQDEYNNWVKERKNLFIETKEYYFATIADGKIKFNIDLRSTKDLKLAERVKTLGGVACVSYYEPILEMFVEWLNGKGFPEYATTKVKKCIYTSFVTRNAIVDKKENFIWWTPEEWAIFHEPVNDKDLRKRINS